MRAVLLGLFLLALTAAPPTRTPSASPPTPPAPVRDCTRCHDENGWQRARFDHDATLLPLNGRHAEVSCRACHRRLDHLGLDPSCDGCHTDVHAGRLGRACVRCHDTLSFASGAGVEAHGLTRFPLYGRHALVPCDACHEARADRTQGGLSRACAHCHERDLARTAGTPFDHTPMGTPLDCRPCHTPVAWSLARFEAHDQCFPLYGSPHDNIRCLDCHTSLQGLVVRSCTTFTASCTRCHTCQQTDPEHQGEVAGYQCRDRKCYECHPSGTED